MPRLKPQIATSLVERVATEIKSSILSGALRPGEQFSIAELCSELDVSHIPVREALRRLEADGLVMLRPGKSAIVTPLTIDELEEVYALRLLIEPEMAAKSASRYTPELLASAERLCEELRPVAASESDDSAESEAHRRLHELLLSPAAGPHTTRTLHRLWDAVDRYISLVYDARPIPPDARYTRHRELVEVAQRRRGPEMRRALAEHLKENEEYMIASLRPVLDAGDAEPRAGVA